MHSHKDINVNKFRSPTAKHFIKGEVWNFQRGKLCSLLTVNAEKWGVKISGGGANLLFLNFCVLPALSSHLSVFSKLCIMNICIFSFCYCMPVMP